VAEFRRVAHPVVFRLVIVSRGSSTQRANSFRGERDIDPAEAEVIKSIFAMFVAGSSPRSIARKLNQAGVDGPGGRKWRDTTIRGHSGRGTGILRNELYIGRLVWNRQSFVRDPHTGKRLSRPNPKDKWIFEEVPKLRIVILRGC
jgi:site-specific DNA recombinase